MYKIIIPFETQGFILDANVLHKYFPDSKIYISTTELQNSNVNIFIDRVIHNSLLNTAKINIIVANQEVMLTSKHYEWEIKFMKRVDYVLCRTHYGKKIMKKLKDKYSLKYKIFNLGFTTLFPIRSVNGINKRDFTTILHLAGAHEFKNTDAVIKCWLKYENLPPIIISCYDNCIKNGLQKYLTPDEFNKAKNHKNIKLITHKMDYEEIVNMKYHYAIHLCPSITEGYGHYINESRITKSVIITSDLPPMNEFINNNSGFLVECGTIMHKDNNNAICIMSEINLKNIVDTVINTNQNDLIQLGENAYKNYSTDKHIFKANAKYFNKKILSEL